MLIRDNNNFDLIRLSLSLIVCFFHISIITNVEEFIFFSNYLSAGFAVKCFFIISGFLVTLSYLNSQNYSEYIKKRFYRIFPAYLTAIILCIFIGFYCTSLDSISFFNSRETWGYFIFNLLFLNFIQPWLPGVFLDHSIQNLNASLWTIKIEILLYLLVPILLFLKNKINFLYIFFVCLVISYIWTYYFNFISISSYSQAFARQLPGQLSFFIIGVFFALNLVYLKFIKYILVATMVIFFMDPNPIIRIVFEPIFFSSIILYFALKFPYKFRLTKFGDLSYGIYLFHFPITQLMFHNNIFINNPWYGLFITMTLIILISFLSWHFIEKKYLRS